MPCEPSSEQRPRLRYLPRVATAYLLRLSPARTRASATRPAPASTVACSRAARRASFCSRRRRRPPKRRGNGDPSQPDPKPRRCVSGSGRHRSSAGPSVICVRVARSRIHIQISRSAAHVERHTCSVGRNPGVDMCGRRRESFFATGRSTQAIVRPGPRAPGRRACRWQTSKSALNPSLSPSAMPSTGRNSTCLETSASKPTSRIALRRVQQVSSPEYVRRAHPAAAPSAVESGDR